MFKKGHRRAQCGGLTRNLWMTAVDLRVPVNILARHVTLIACWFQGWAWYTNTELFASQSN